MSLSADEAAAFDPNPSRAIFLTGEITQETVDLLTPQILALRGVSGTPITVYIDSPGGNVWASQVLLGLLKTPNPDGSRCRLITVATGRAFSAAADFLALGDYALCYPNAAVLCHGTRRYLNSPLTTEIALSYSESLRVRNEISAFQLAEKCIDRFMFRYLILNGDSETGATYANLEAVARRLTGQLSLTESPCVAEIPRLALKRFNELSTVNSKLQKQRIEKAGERPAQRQARILKALIDYELRVHPDEDWEFSSSLRSLQEDFAYVEEHLSETYMVHLRTLSARFGAYFLTKEDQEHCASFPEPEQLERKNAMSIANLHPVWYFYVSICRVLQTNDYLMNPIDAYWMGLVDDVIGENLPSSRTALDRFNQVGAEDSESSK